MPMILAVDQIRAWDAFTIENEPIRPIDLMERAAIACVAWLQKHHPESRHFLIFCGRGNNGGDGLAIGRLLLSQGAQVEIYIVGGLAARGSGDFMENLSRWQKAAHRDVNWLETASDFPQVLSPHFPSDARSLILDALFGSGLNRPLQGLAEALVRHINNLPFPILSIDLPSGMIADGPPELMPAPAPALPGGDLGRTNSKVSYQYRPGSIGFAYDSTLPSIIRATKTLSFQLPKLAFFLPENGRFTGEVHIVDIGLTPRFLLTQDFSFRILDTAVVRKLYRPRDPFAHKGHFGHALLLAGSQGKSGAALLAARACMHSGVGLLTVGVPGNSLDVLQIGVPEAMVLPDEQKTFLASLRPFFNSFQAVGIGPGLGTAAPTRGWLLDLLGDLTVPLVLDADALNILAQEEKLAAIPRGTILTPHPREFDRLTGPSTHSLERIEKARKLARELECIVVLKGHHTLIACPESCSWFNTTGNVGMATAGSGDVLTGILTGLLAQGYSPREAACLGVWLHGRAGDLAAAGTGKEAGYGYESLTASGIIAYIGAAFRSLRLGYP